MGWSKEEWKNAIKNLQESWKKIEEECIYQEKEKELDRFEKSKYLAEQKLWRLEELGQKDYTQKGFDVPITVIARFRLGSENLNSQV